MDQWLQTAEALAIELENWQPALKEGRKSYAKYHYRLDMQDLIQAVLSSSGSWQPGSTNTIGWYQKHRWDWCGWYRFTNREGKKLEVRILGTVGLGDKDKVAWTMSFMATSKNRARMVSRRTFKAPVDGDEAFAQADKFLTEWAKRKSSDYGISANLAFEMESYRKLRGQAMRLVEYEKTLRKASGRAKAKKIALAQGKTNFIDAAEHAVKWGSNSLSLPEESILPNTDLVMMSGRGGDLWLTLPGRQVSRHFEGAKKFEQAWMWLILWAPRGSSKWVRDGESVEDLITRVQKEKVPRK